MITEKLAEVWNGNRCCSICTTREDDGPSGQTINYDKEILPCDLKVIRRDRLEGSNGLVVIPVLLSLLTWK